MPLPAPLVSAHTHAAMGAFAGLVGRDLPLQRWLEEAVWPAEAAAVTRDFVRSETAKSIRELRARGVGAFADMYFFADAVAEAAISENMPVLIGEGLLDFPTPSAKTFDDGLAETERLLEKYRDHPTVRVAVAPHAIYTVCEKNLLRAKKLADKFGAIFHIHLAETRREVADCREKTSKTPVGFLDALGILDGKTLAAHSIHVTDDDLEILARRGVSVAHCPHSNLRLGAGIAPVAKMLAAGVRVALGTDGAASAGRLDVWDAARIAGFLAKGAGADPTLLPGAELVKMASTNGLRAIGFTEWDGKNLDEIGREIEAREWPEIWTEPVPPGIVG